MAKPGLTEAETYAIRAMLDEGLSVNKIATKLRRSNSVVTKFIKEKLPNAAALQDKTRDYLTPEVESYIYNKLLDSQLEPVDARASIQIAKNHLKEPVALEQADMVVSWCLRRVNPGSMFQKRTEGGKKGVTVMTPGASEVLDSLRHNRKTKNTDDHIFKQEHAVPKIQEDEDINLQEL